MSDVLISVVEDDKAFGLVFHVPDALPPPGAHKTTQLWWIVSLMRKPCPV